RKAPPGNSTCSPVARTAPGPAVRTAPGTTGGGAGAPAAGEQRGEGPRTAPGSIVPGDTMKWMYLSATDGHAAAAEKLGQADVFGHADDVEQPGGRTRRRRAARAAAICRIVGWTFAMTGRLRGKTESKAIVPDQCQIGAEAGSLRPIPQGMCGIC